jgi:hypothetical protein
MQVFTTGPSPVQESPTDCVCVCGGGICVCYWVWSGATVTLCTENEQAEEARQRKIVFYQNFFKRYYNYLLNVWSKIKNIHGVVKLSADKNYSTLPLPFHPPSSAPCLWTCSITTGHCSITAQYELHHSSPSKGRVSAPVHRVSVQKWGFSTDAHWLIFSPLSGHIPQSDNRHITSEHARALHGLRRLYFCTSSYATKHGKILNTKLHFAQTHTARGYNRCFAVQKGGGKI